MNLYNIFLRKGYFYAFIFSRKSMKKGGSSYGRIYSAMIPVKEAFSKKEFVRLLLEWNQGSPHDRMKGVRLGWGNLHFVLAGETKTAGSGRSSGEADNCGKISETDRYGMIWTSDLSWIWKKRDFLSGWIRRWRNRQAHFFTVFLHHILSDWWYGRGMLEWMGGCLLQGSPYLWVLEKKNWQKGYFLEKSIFNCRSFIWQKNGMAVILWMPICFRNSFKERLMYWKRRHRS